MADATHRAGAVAILGRPNAGKSTLLNHLVGQKLAIVTAKPQTTRSRILGIVTRDDAQILLYDTPGMHESTRALNQALNEIVAGTADNCDVALLLVDPRDGWGDDHTTLCERLRAKRCPLVVASTKRDLGGAGRRWPEHAPEPVPISAKTGAGVDALLGAVIAQLPESPPLYPEDQVSDRPLRFLAAELVREAAMEELSQELPYASAVEVEEFDESREGLVRIRANLLVERPSQKQIAIGAGGRVIRAIGIRARREIETLVGCQVHLELWVKVDRQWAKQPRRRRALGYT